MADRLPFGGNGQPTRANSPKRMLYTRTTWTLPAANANTSELQYDLATGRITQAEFDAGMTRNMLNAKEREVAAVAPAREHAVVSTPRSRRG